jgi:riboflavin kinase/FMN adenylyltransferase
VQAVARLSLQPCVIAPGNHDGVHLGHQALIARARAHASQHGLRAVALTFDPHPAAVLAPERAPMPLTTIARRRELLRLAGADDVLVLPFTHALASLSPEAFLEALRERGARALVVGPDFRFGRGRAGDIALLQEYGRAHELDALIEPNLLLNGARVSSTAVREALQAGAVERAATMLGHLPELQGEVVGGQRRGRTIGFPTANLATDPVLHPADGVYAVVARVLPASPAGASAPGTLLHGVANLGVRPTVAAGRSVEVHLFDFDQDLYSQHLRVGFVARIRPEQRFSGLPELRAQIALDCERARATLATSERGLWHWI